MLVLTRERGEAIVIGDNVTVTIVEIRGDQVRLGIDAPREITIHRQEVFDELQSENRRAATTAKDDLRLLPKPPNRSG
ncbi:MAG: carbon storage regulator CsrA [Acidimicrobiales bacterium]